VLFFRYLYTHLFTGACYWRLARYCCVKITNIGFSKEAKVFRQEKGYGSKFKFINEFPIRNWSGSFLNKFLTKLHQTRTMDCKPGSGKKRKTRIEQNVIIQFRSWY